MAEAYELAAELEKSELGVYRISYYCSCEQCCGKSDGITALGTVAEEGRTVAAPEEIPLGTEISIGGKSYVVEDRGGAIKGKRIDIYLESHEECVARGITYETVTLEQGGVR